MLVFLMAAVVAIALYREIPRVALQSQRHKEQLLVERGEQFKRAIQVYYATTRRYPQNMDDLETAQRRHFLRHKYIDPMTGKSEWRIIHIQGGVLVDSVLTKNPGNQQKQGTGESNYISAYAGLDQSAGAGGPQIRPQDRRRASEGGAGGAQPGMPGAVLPQGDGSNPDGQQAGMQPQTGMQPQPGMPGNQIQGMPGMVSNLPPGVPGMPPGMQGGQSAGNFQNQGGGYVTAMPGIGVTSSPQPSQAYPVQPNPNMPGYSNMQGSQAGFQNMPGGQAGFPTAPGGSPSVPQMISDILTRPNPAGYAAVLRAQQQQQGGSPGMTGATIGAGLAAGGNGMAGIASAAESDGIMVYNDRTAYNEWEFIFDPSKVPAIPPVPGGGMGGTPASKMGTPASQLNPSAGFGAGMGTPGAAGGPAGMRMGGDFSALGAGGAQGATGAAGGIAGMQMGQANGVAGMQMGITGMNSTGLPAGFRPGRP